MLDVRLFGPTSVTTADGRPVLGEELGGAKPRQILEILAISAGTPVPKDHLAELLWEGAPPRSYLGTLESYVCVLRRALGHGRGRGSAVSTVLHGYVLDPQAVRVDLSEFRRLVREAGATPCAATALGRVQEAMDLARGGLLASEAYATWAIREREVFARELVSAATAGAARALTLGDHPAAVLLARRAIEGDRLAEDAWRLLMRGLSGAGQRPEAMRAYSDLREHLAEELGVDPSPESTALFLEVLGSGGGSDGAGAHRGAPAGGEDAREEVRMLLRLLRQAVASVPGLALPPGDRALVRVATDLATAS